MMHNHIAMSELWYVLCKQTIHRKLWCVHRQLWFVCFGPACLVSYIYCKPQVSMHKQIWYVCIGTACLVIYSYCTPQVPMHKQISYVCMWPYTKSYEMYIDNCDLCVLDPSVLSVIIESHKSPWPASMHKPIWYVCIGPALVQSQKVMIST